MNKCYLLPIKKTTVILLLNGNQLESKNEQKDSGVLISTKINWKSNCEKCVRNPGKLTFT